jgi:hypothetical protein
MSFTDFTMGLGMGPGADYGPSAAAGDPSGYNQRMRLNRADLVVGVIVIAVLFMLIAGVIALRLSGEVVI